MIAAGFPLARYRLLIFMRQYLQEARNVRLHGRGGGGGWMEPPPFWHSMDLAAAKRRRLLDLIASERAKRPPPPSLPAQLDLFA